ncbi:MAG: sulfite exporter TauE/SafE family protein [Acidocella sp.]|nr:sulfite exporter TauE/SafE family protein [Acidocella sp.]
MSAALYLKVDNMHCAACEVRVERKIRALPGVNKVHVSHVSGQAKVSVTGGNLKLQDFEDALVSDGYTVSWWAERAQTKLAATGGNTSRDYAEVGSILLLLLAVWSLLSHFELLPKGLAINDHMSYGFVFLIGVVAAFSSCLAVTGGLLLSVAAKYNEQYPNLDGWQKFKPTLYFNAGRVISYTILGGAVGGLGSVFTLSQRGNGILSILASLVMIILGFQLLHLFPWMRRLQPRMPNALAHRIHDFSGKSGTTRSAPLVLGALTFFLPCGFTQALQFYVLSTGNPMTGALTMLAFSLGTLPSLLSLSMVSSFARGSFQTHFLRFAGVVVVLVGFWNIKNGLALADINLPWTSFNANSDSASSVPLPIIGGVQTAKMTINGYDYSPSHFTVQAGVPVKWQIDGSNATGCARIVLSSSLKIAKYVSPDQVTTVTFIPREAGNYSFSCPMGMTTRGAAITVLPSKPGTALVADASDEVGDTTTSPQPIAGGQTFNMEISQENGFYPNSFTVKKGVPLTLQINDKVPLPGCLGVMVIPEYDVTVPFQLGINTLSFTPTKTGIIYGECSMGSKMIRFVVVN